MGNDQNEKEELAEVQATQQKLHPLLKVWYSASHNAELPALRTKHGAFPSFWQDLATWGGWKDVYSLYLKVSEKRKIGDDMGGEDKEKGEDKKEDKEEVPKKKRRSRWGAKAEPGEEEGEKTQKRGRSRWGASTQKEIQTIVPGVGMISLTPDTNKKYLSLQLKLKELGQKINDIAIEVIRVKKLPKSHPDRSPSPPPIYDSYGRKTNSREARWKERYEENKLDVMEEIYDLDRRLLPGSFTKRKRKGKVFIPVKDHPTYNFIGLIIGPRGKTQRELEAKTGCKVAIRGKGSVKEGARGRRDGKAMEGEDEDLHVLLTGDTKEQVDRACQVIRDMLVVIDDDKNEHKQRQLRELAIMNGTLKEDEYCTLCAQKGHRAFACPTRFNSYKGTGVSIKCSICGDASHVARDCPVAAAGGGRAGVTKEVLDTEYASFMNELDGKAPPPPKAGLPPGTAGGAGQEEEEIPVLGRGPPRQQMCEVIPVLGRGGPRAGPPMGGAYGVGGPGAQQQGMGRGRGRGRGNTLPAWMTQGGGGVGGEAAESAGGEGDKEYRDAAAAVVAAAATQQGGQQIPPPPAMPQQQAVRPPNTMPPPNQGAYGAYGQPPPPVGGGGPGYFGAGTYGGYGQQQQQGGGGGGQGGGYGAYGQQGQGMAGQPNGLPPQPQQGAMAAPAGGEGQGGKELSWMEQQMLIAKQKKETEEWEKMQQQGGGVGVWDPTQFYGQQQGYGQGGWWDKGHR
ncbi:hypothetical protein TrCOL_g2625 [Triparma columacea]|uniref:Branchpoint-bridging protein n=1 Tax=Triparma columacea TaxID=722753 RepID=A0A9W7GG59_9STRA|nr:hypothetical protein TrCOL_g2625 [Triparma columacea]